LPFHIFFIVNIARKRPELNRDKTKHAYANQSAAIMAIAPKIGCGRDTLRRWIKQSDIDSGRKEGQSSDERAQIKAMEREIRDLRQANEILRKASAYFAQAELARPFKR
jgi:transposase